MSYHRVYEAIAANILRFHFIESKQNPSDILTKPLDHATAWPHIDTLLFRKGDTMPNDNPRNLRGVSSDQVAHAASGASIATLGHIATYVEPQNVIGSP